MAKGKGDIDVLDVKEMEIGDVPGLASAWEKATRELRSMMMDIDDGKLKPGSVMSLTVKVSFLPKRDGVSIAADYKVGLPAYVGDGTHALYREGKFLVFEAEQAELPGVLRPSFGE